MFCKPPKEKLPVTIFVNLLSDKFNVKILDIIDSPLLFPNILKIFCKFPIEGLWQPIIFKVCKLLPTEPKLVISVKKLLLFRPIVVAPTNFEKSNVVIVFDFLFNALCKIFVILSFDKFIVLIVVGNCKSIWVIPHWGALKVFNKVFDK